MIRTTGKHVICNVELAYEVIQPAQASGDDTSSKWVVLVNGAGLDQRSWESQVEPLVSAGFRVLKYDFSGSGQSSPADSYTLDDDVDHLAGLIDTIVGPTDKIHLVGLSHGSVIAQLYAGQYPHRIASVTFAGGPMTPTGMNPKFAEHLQELKKVFQEKGMQDAIKYNAENSPVIVLSKDLGHWDEILEIMTTQSGARFAHTLQQSTFVKPRLDATQVLQQLTTPMLHVDGAVDAELPHVAARAEWIRDNVPGFRRREGDVIWKGT